MSKSRLTVLTAALALLTGVSYAAEKIAFTCSDEKNEAYSFVFDLDRKIVSSSMKTGDVMPITRVTDSQIWFGNKGLAAIYWEGTLDRNTGSLSLVNRYLGNTKSYSLQCKPDNSPS